MTDKIIAAFCMALGLGTLIFIGVSAQNKIAEKHCEINYEDPNCRERVSIGSPANGWDDERIQP